MPTHSRISEGTVNEAIGQLLRAKNVQWEDCIKTEKTGVIYEGAGKRPDIIVNHPGGLPVAIESEFDPARTVEADARSRLGKSLSADGRNIEQTIALRLPTSIAQSNQKNLQETLESSIFKFALLRQEDVLIEVRWPEKGWIEGGIDDFINFVEQTSLSESLITQGMALLEKRISQAAYMVERDRQPHISTHREIAGLLNQKDCEQTTRMAMAILANAISFHNTISKIHDIKPITEILDPFGNYCQRRLHKEWMYVLREVNYWPIFEIASKLLSSIRSKVADEVFDRLANAAIDLEKIGATSQHDLSGRMLQRLISDRKFLATFYTLPSSAALLSELAISRLTVDWSNAENITNLQIADFACGTGALLNASYSAVLARFRRTGGDDRELHAPMMEKTLVGTDIMPAATHLTASILSSVHPSLPFLSTRIITLPYGKKETVAGESIEIGALDLITDEEVFSLFRTGQERLVGAKGGDTSHVELRHKSFDLVIMNPPFARPTNHAGEHKDIPNPAFAGFSTTEEEQSRMAKKLKDMCVGDTAGHGNAGLASNFIDIAEAKIKARGVLALVLPFTFATGTAWASARRLLERFYSDLIVVSIANAQQGGSAFSADTGMGEVLVIATRNECEHMTKPQVTYINLDHRPTSIAEASETARTITNIEQKSKKGLLKIGSDLQIGHYIRSKSGFNGCAGIRDNEVAQIACEIYNGRLTLPRKNEALDVALLELGEMGRRGPLSRDINGMEKSSQIPRGPFDVENIVLSHEKVTFPMLWAHDSKKETRLIVDIDRHGIVRQGHDSKAIKIWDNFAGRLSFNQNFRLNSQPLSACFSSETAIASQAWIGFKCQDISHEVPILLFANSIVGLISHWWRGTRQQVGRTMLKLTSLPHLMTLDPRDFTPVQFAKADEIFDRFKTQDLLPANEAYRDDVRQSLDEAVFVELLGLDRDIIEPLSILRQKWCAEPSVHGGKSTRPM